MKIINREIKNYRLNVEIVVDKDEFDRARYETYMNSTDIYPVSGKAPGLASLIDLEQTYGPAVLFDDALAKIIPDTFNEFLTNDEVRIMGKPQVEDMQFTLEGGVKFKVLADTYPDVELGQYKGIAVPFRRDENQLEFEQAVVQKACENMKGEIPPHMIMQKMDAITAQEKLNINNDAVYHLLADMLVILDQAYVSAGVSRPKVQIRREAMDLMLQTASAEHELDWKDFMRNQLHDMVERYHDLPADFDARLDKIMKNRDAAKSKMTPDEVTEEIFKVYLGSQELTEEQWKNQRELQAARDVCLDLLLDAVAKEEELNVNADEVHAFIEELADQYTMEPEEAEANIDRQALEWKLKRDKALALVLNSAVCDEAAKAELDKKREEAMKKMSQEAEIAGR